MIMLEILNVFITIYKLQLSSGLSELIESMIQRNGGAAGSWRWTPSSTADLLARFQVIDLVTPPNPSILSVVF